MTDSTIVDSNINYSYGPMYSRRVVVPNGTSLYSPPVHSYDTENRPNIIVRFFRAIGRFFRRLFGIQDSPVHPQPPVIIDRETPGDTVPSSPSSPRLSSYRQRLMTCASVNEQMSYLSNTVLPEVNRELPSALQEFNRHSGLDLRCTGITPGTLQLPLGLVFTTVSGSSPVRILLSDTELAGKNKEEIVQMLDSRVREHRALFSTQNRIWANSTVRFNPERGRTSFVGICIPGNITGLENDYSELIRTVWGGIYNANIRGVCMQNTSAWNSLRGSNLPAATGTTRTQILDTISSSTQEAMADNHTGLIIQLTGHGNQNGTMQVSGGQLNPREMIQRIAQELRRNPNTSLRNFHFIVESCFSDAQREEYERAIQELLSGFSNITASVTVSSGRHTESSAGSNSGNSAHINPRITGSNSGTLAHNLSLIYQVNPNISLSDALRWVDLNARLDSHTRQNMQGYCFRRGERNQYTRDNTISNDPYNPNPPVITLALN